MTVETYVDKKWYDSSEANKETTLKILKNMTVGDCIPIRVSTKLNKSTCTPRYLVTLEYIIL